MTVEDLRNRVDPFRARVAGAVRRMTVKLTSKALWQLVGFKIGGKEHVARAEVFGGIGWYARPPASGKPEAIVIMLNDADEPIVVAVRDEKTRAAIASAIAEDEAMAFTSKLLAWFRSSNETIELRKVGGTAAFVAMLADLTNLKNAINNWTPVAGDGGAALKTALTALFTGPPTWPAGSKVVKVE